eukprot:TRINITY_DN1316_c1_g1_i11.p2 TRINITY_DN1316_c1_g1~~TRINITY_DN1316_c1_g1_i11.p2  ORF type:complete len:164 (-),score=17.21 TRINITY_DN1316_c1_g1_i11:308-799(-)
MQTAQRDTAVDARVQAGRNVHGDDGRGGVQERTAPGTASTRCRHAVPDPGSSRVSSDCGWTGDVRGEEVHGGEDTGRLQGLRLLLVERCSSSSVCSQDRCQPLNRRTAGGHWDATKNECIKKTIRSPERWATCFVGPNRTHDYIVITVLVNKKETRIEVERWI